MKIGGDGGPGTATDWSDAYGGLQTALAASASGDEIWVKTGTYGGPFTLVDGVDQYGGFIGTETERDARYWSSNLTVLNGGGPVVTCPGGATSSTRLDGFKITGGSFSGGGGMRNYDYSSPTVANGTFSGNTAGFGAAVQSTG